METQNYMGVLVLNHITKNSPVLCAGAQMPSNSITEVALHSASWDPKTRQAIPGELLVKLRMTEGQFGDAIASPNRNDGLPMTLEYLHTHRVESLDANPESETLSRIVENARQGDRQTLDVLEHLFLLAQNAAETGRMNKSQQADFLKNLGLILMYTPENERHAMEQVNEVAHRRVLEVAKTLHRVVRQSKDVTTQALPAPPMQDSTLPTMSPFGLFYISTSLSTSERFFDDINTHDRAIALRFKNAEPDSSEYDSSITPSYKNKGTMFEVLLSPGQYTRMLRADTISMPCTISFRFGKRMDSVAVEHTAEINQNVNKEHAPQQTQAMSALGDAVQSISESLTNGHYRGKKGFASLLDDVRKLPEFFSDHIKERLQGVDSEIDALLSQHQARISQHINNELASLPHEAREDAMSHLTPLLEHIRKG